MTGRRTAGSAVTPDDTDRTTATTLSFTVAVSSLSFILVVAPHVTLFHCGDIHLL